MRISLYYQLLNATLMLFLSSLSFNSYSTEFNSKLDASYLWATHQASSANSAPADFLSQYGSLVSYQLSIPKDRFLSYGFIASQKHISFQQPASKNVSNPNVNLWQSSLFIQNNLGENLTFKYQFGARQVLTDLVDSSNHLVFETPWTTSLCIGAILYKKIHLQNEFIGNFHKGPIHGQGGMATSASYHYEISPKIKLLFNYRYEKLHGNIVEFTNQELGVGIDVGKLIDEVFK